MLNMFELWTGMLRSGAAVAQTGFQFAETMGASHSVVQSRVRTMADAARSPLTGDYAELGRMVPEKVDAFSKATLSAMSDMQAIQSQVMTSWQSMFLGGMAGRVPGAKEWGALATGNARIVDLVARSGGKALAPVHRAATANAKRLSRTN